MTGPEAAALPLHEWEGFYVIVGTSAAALTGLMFVVIAVVADAGPRAATPRGIATFLTPTIVHFCLALVISAILSARWPRPFEVQIILALLAVGGLIYTLVVLRRALGVPNYTVVLEDWVWHVVFPLLAYALVLMASLWLESMTPLALLLVGGASVLLVLIGIHNAWDTVTYLIMQRMQGEQEKTEK
ncbi:MAG TPA: hypothetical protein VFO35_21745 [Steroidobacteraceae bacterium]|nr:hypothetical protein [Steroidobacteraceae bacterium]